MQNDGKFRSRLFFVITLNAIVLGLLVVLSNLTYAQEDVPLHEKSLYEITNHTSKQSSFITVGSEPTDIGVNSFTNTIYVANFEDNTVSVINGKNNTKIKDIEVGKGPTAIGINRQTDTTYVANYGDNTVSVINGKNNTKIKDIEVGKGPTAIGINQNTFFDVDSIYVANRLDNTVSVINTTNNSKIKDIEVGKGPVIYFLICLQIQYMLLTLEMTLYL